MKEILKFVEELKKDSGADRVEIISHARKPGITFRLSRGEHHTEILYPACGETWARERLIENFKTYLKNQIKRG